MITQADLEEIRALGDEEAAKPKRADTLMGGPMDAAFRDAFVSVEHAEHV